jgi:hypothetical protein
MDVPVYVLEHVFFKIDTLEGDVIRWAPVKEGGEGYVVLWENGDYHHTYHYPPDTWI